MAILLPTGKQAFTGAGGLPLSGGKLYTYAAGTNTPKSTWADAAETAANQNPVVLNARGEALIYWSGTYRVELRDRFGNLIWSVDNVGTPAAVPGPATYATIATLAAGPSANGAAILSDPLRGGTFIWHAGDQSALVASDPGQGIAIAAASDPTGLSGAWVRDYAGPFYASWWGADPTGVANATDGLFQASQFIQRRGGGALQLAPGGKYLVGRQVAGGGGNAFQGQPILSFNGCTSQIVIDLNGSTLKAIDGYRYGTFNADGTAKNTVAPHTGPTSEYAFPWLGMIAITGCSGGYAIYNGTLDGNNGKAILGGQWGDLGWQVNGCGLYLIGNSGPVDIRDVTAPNQPWDGMLFNHVGSASGSNRTFSRIRISGYSGDNAGRQALSVTGGVGGYVTASRFARAGKGPWGTAPSAGIDFEAELTQQVRDWVFELCEVDNNAGAGLLGSVSTPQSYVENVLFKRCRVVGATNLATYLVHPGVRFEDCTIVGASVQAWNGDSDDTRRTRHLRTLFTDDPGESPGGVVYAPGGMSIYDTVTPQSVLFDDCEYRLIGLAKFPGCGPQAEHRNCRGQQAAGDAVQMLGTFIGENVFTTSGALNIFNPASRIRGRVSINGVDQQFVAYTVQAQITIPASGRYQLGNVGVPFFIMGDDVVGTPTSNIEPCAVTVQGLDTGVVRASLVGPPGATVAQGTVINIRARSQP